MESRGTVTPLQPPAAYIGGKSRLAETILPLIEAVPHRVYAEPFVGMGGIFLRRRYRAPVEIVNDISLDVVTLFRVMKRHPEELARQFDFELTGRTRFEAAQAQDPAHLTDIERAARFLVLQRLAYGGKAAGRSYGVGRERQRSLRPAVLLREMGRLHDRLADVVVECLPFGEFLVRYDGPEVLFYLDPPYWGSEADYGKGVFGRADFGRMADILAGLAARWILSINDVPETRRVFSAFDIRPVTTNWSIGNRMDAGDGRELLIGNPLPAPPQGALDV